MERNITIYNGFNRAVAFEGTLEECRNWLFGKARDENCGIYRTWESDGEYYYDIEHVYICPVKLDASNVDNAQ